MDPRLNPQFNPPQAPMPAPPAGHPTAPAAQAAPQPRPAAPTPVQHQPQPATPPAPPAHESLKTEIVEAIPVHQPGQAQAESTPAEPVIQLPNSSPPSSAAEPAQPHDDLDKILQAVNNRVATPAPAPASPKSEIVKKIADKAAKVKPANSGAKPIGLTLAVIAIALALSFLAYRAYHQTNSAASLSNQPGKVGTSYTASGAIQSAGGALVRPADLDDYSQELQTKLDSLNDSQDFAANSLSDQVLGL
jgi:hypothetical protein